MKQNIILLSFSITCFLIRLKCVLDKKRYLHGKAVLILDFINKIPLKNLMTVQLYVFTGTRFLLAVRNYKLVLGPVISAYFSLPDSTPRNWYIASSGKNLRFLLVYSRAVKVSLKPNFLKLVRSEPRLQSVTESVIKWLSTSRSSG
jgi:hypothetical protein